ncbi:hypothetical protein ACFLZR_00590 [Candidatus Neomarinimicrobiota bacterium]
MNIPILKRALIPIMVMLFTQCSSEPVRATFMKSYGGPMSDEGYSVEQTSDGGYIIVGSVFITTNTGQNIWLVKTDAYGDTLWTRHFGTYSQDRGRALRIASNGDYIFLGAIRIPPYRLLLTRTKRNGDLIWSKEVLEGDVDTESTLQVTRDGGAIIGAAVMGTDGYSDMGLIKTDANGDTLWTTSIGGFNLEEGTGVQETLDGGYLLIGYTESLGVGDGDIVLSKVDATGEYEWDQALVENGYQRANASLATADSGFILAGEIGIKNSPVESDMFLMKVNSTGEVMWMRTHGGDQFETAYSVQSTSDGGYILTGTTSSYGAGAGDVWLVKTDGEGFVQWTRTFGGENEDDGFSVRQTSDGGYIIAGQTQSFSQGFYDLFLIKTDEEGFAVSYR